VKRFDFINGKYKEHLDPISHPMWVEKHGCDQSDCPRCGKKVFKIDSIYGGFFILDAYPEYDGQIFITDPGKKAAKIGFKSNRPMPRYRIHRCV